LHTWQSLLNLLPGTYGANCPQPASPPITYSDLNITFSDRLCEGKLTRSLGCQSRALRKHDILNPVTVASNGADALTMLLGDDHRDQGNPFPLISPYRRVSPPQCDYPL
jgi:hypothetical protein